MQLEGRIAVAWLAVFQLAAVVWGAQAVERPNFIFIFIDDMGYSDMSCFGGTRVQTPNIDGLAREGIRFTQFYVNSPICSPSRVAVTTGQYPGRWKITSYLDKRKIDKKRGVADWLSPKAPSLARCLAKAGYYTAHVGKWHMGGQRDVGDAPLIGEYGFATSLTSFEGLGERVLPRFDRRNDGTEVRHTPTIMSAELGGGPIHWVDRHKVTEFYVDRAIKEMRTAAGKKQPFYINLWLDDMHGPVQAPPNLRGDGSATANYLGVMKEMDRQLGRAFDFIRSQPSLVGNTVIFLASDNGPDDALSMSPGQLGVSTGQRGGKARLYDGGIRSPFIAWYHGIPKSAVGSTNQKTVLAGMDIPPSVIALANVAVPGGVRFDGLNMADAFAGRASPKRDKPIMWVRPPDRPGPKNDWPDLAIRNGDWKLLINRDRSRPELFNIIDDPSESKNLAEKHADMVKQLGDKVIQWDKTIIESVN